MLVHELMAIKEKHFFTISEMRENACKSAAELKKKRSLLKKILGTNETALDFAVDFGNEIVIEPNDEVEIMVSFAPDDVEEYDGRLRIVSTDPVDPQVIVALTGSGIEPGVLHFVDFDQTEINHSVLVTSLTLRDENVPDYWEIGVFTEDGLLAGAEVWLGEAGIAVWGAEPNLDNGFHLDEPFTFLVWDNEANEEYDAEADYTIGPHVWTYDGMTALTLNAFNLNEFRVSFTHPWDYISIPLVFGQELYEEDDDRGADVVLIMEQLRRDDDHLLNHIKDSEGRFYNTIWNFNNIPYWNPLGGYQSLVFEDVEGVWTGERLPPDEDIPLNEGWNMIAYLPTWELDASAPDFYVVSTILDDLILAKDSDGRFMAPDWNYSNMEPWQETQGYKIKVERELIFNYPVPQEGLASIAPVVIGIENKRWSFEPQSANNFSILVKDVLQIEPRPGDQIAAFNGVGDIVGMGEFGADGRFGIAVWGDDLTTEAVEGLAEDEAFELRYWNGEQERALEVNAVLFGRGLVYETDGFTVLEVSLIQALPKEFYLSKNYPNPFNSTTRIQFGLPEAGHVTLAVFDLSGRLVAPLVDKRFVAGVHEVTWNAEAASAGLYLAYLSSGTYVGVKKMIIVK